MSLEPQFEKGFLRPVIDAALSCGFQDEAEAVDQRVRWDADTITALRAALDQERARIRELAESPPMASISLCCGIVRPGHYAPDSMHHGLCRSRHGGELGKTYYLHDVSALLSGRGEGGNDG